MAVPSIFGQATREADDQNQHPLTQLLEALAAQHHQEMEADKIRQSAMQQQMPRPRTPTLLEVLGTGILGGLDRSGRSAEAFSGGLNQGIQNKYQGDLLGFQQQAQGAEQRAQGLEKEGGYQAKRAQAIYGERQRKLEQSSENSFKLQMQKLMNEGKVSVAQMGILMKLPPEARENYAMGMGIDPTTAKAIASMTPNEQSQKGRADESKYNLDVKFPTELGYKGQQVKADVDLKGAQKGLTEAKTLTENAIRESTVKAMSWLAEQRKAAATWLPKTSAARISQGEQRLGLMEKALSSGQMDKYWKLAFEQEADIATAASESEGAKNEWAPYISEYMNLKQMEERDDKQEKRLKQLETIRSKFFGAVQKSAETKKGAQSNLNKIKGLQGAVGNGKSAVAPEAVTVKISPQLLKDRREGILLIRKFPDKAAAIKKKFKETYGEDIGG